MFVASLKRTIWGDAHYEKAHVAPGPSQAHRYAVSTIHQGSLKGNLVTVHPSHIRLSAPRMDSGYGTRLQRSENDDMNYPRIPSRRRRLAWVSPFLWYFCCRVAAK